MANHYIERARAGNLQMDVATAITAEEIVSSSFGVLSLELTVGLYHDKGPLLYDGRPAYYLQLSVAGLDTDDWTYADSADLVAGVAKFLREWQRQIAGTIDNLKSYVPGFTEAWEQETRGMVIVS